MQNNFRPPVAQAANVNSSDANLLNSFFTDLSKQIPKGSIGGANYFNQTFDYQMHSQIQREAARVKQHYRNDPAQLHYILN